jgi:hypothetical protein
LKELIGEEIDYKTRQRQYG